MEAFSLPTAVILAVAAASALLVAIVPTCLYLYVEPRGRLHWAMAGDTPAKRRAPLLVRLTAWLSFVVGQLALPALAIPALCGVLVYLEWHLPVGRSGMAITIGLGIAALLQALLAIRLVPLGVRLLSGDSKAQRKATSIARLHGMVAAGMLGTGMGLRWAIAAIPNFVHPWLGAALEWTAIRPVMGFAAVSLVHALLLGRCAVALTSRQKGP